MRTSQALGYTMNSTSQHVPRLSKTATSHQLLVNGKPFLMLAAELQNSSLTAAAYMRTVWQKLVVTNINTVLGCVTWESIEPQEGTFDFAELDEVIRDARSHGLHLVLLWFGSFKNGLTTYSPAWVKKDHKRFPRAHLGKAGFTLETADVVSIFHEEARKTDAKTFGKLMRHLKDVDQDYSTVIMVQVENETVLLGDSRDRSRAANDRFVESVPHDLVSFLSQSWGSLHPDLRANLDSFQSSGSHGKKSGPWHTVFGKSKQTDELFIAYHYALYLDQVAAAGKKEHPLPLYINVWQNYVEDGANDFPIVAGGGGEPSDYPSGGAVSNTLDIWRAFAPNLDFIASEVYLNDYASSCAKYCHLNQPLFIPEQRRDDFGARRKWKAFESYQAIGTPPFGIDTLEPESNPFRKHYRLLASVSKIVLEAQTRPDSSMGFFFDELDVNGKDTSKPAVRSFGDFEVKIERSFLFGRAGPGAGVLIHLGYANFLLIGWGFRSRSAACLLRVRLLAS